MQVLNALGNAERGRGNREAALAWYERSLELAERLGSVQGQADARGNRAILLSEQAEETTDPPARLRLLNQGIAEERERLMLEQQLGQPARIAIGHYNLADRLRQLAEARGTGFQPVDRPDHGQDARATPLDEGEQHGLQALAIFERLNSPETWKTLELLARIAESRGDAAAAADYRRRKEAAHAEAEQRAGRQGLPPQTIVALLQLALTTRAQRLDFADALRSAGADDPAALLAAIQQHDPWLAAHLSALATGNPRPAADAPAQFADLLDQAWQAAT